MTDEFIYYNYEEMSEYRPDRPGAGKPLAERMKEPIWRVYKQKSQIVNHEIISENLTGEEAQKLVNKLNDRK